MKKLKENENGLIVWIVLSFSDKIKRKGKRDIIVPQYLINSIL